MFDFGRAGDNVAVGDCNGDAAEDLGVGQPNAGGGLSLTAPRGAKWAEQIGSERLSPGRYLLKLYIDESGILQKDFDAELGEEDFVGQVEVESRWPAGYGKMTVAQFPGD